MPESKKVTIEITDSSMLTKAVYDPDTETLEATYVSGKKTYSYSPVTLDEFGQFQKAASKGSFFLKHVRNKDGIKSVLLSQEERRSEPRQEVPDHF